MSVFATLCHNLRLAFVARKKDGLDPWISLLLLRTVMRVRQPRVDGAVRTAGGRGRRGAGTRRRGQVQSGGVSHRVIVSKGKAGAGGTAGRGSGRGGGGSIV